MEGIQFRLHLGEAMKSEDISFSLRGLCDLGVSAVNTGFKYIHRGDAENAKVAQRISN